MNIFLINIGRLRIYEWSSPTWGFHQRSFQGQCSKTVVAYKICTTSPRRRPPASFMTMEWPHQTKLLNKSKSCENTFSKMDSFLVYFCSGPLFLTRIQDIKCFESSRFQRMKWPVELRGAMRNFLESGAGADEEGPSSWWYWGPRPACWYLSPVSRFVILLTCGIPQASVF